MKKQSAGILVYRRVNGGVEVLLGHPGGPFWAKKDAGAWSIPKGEYEEGEDPLTAAKREFHEETGQSAPDGDYSDLGDFKRKDGKTIKAWAVQGDIDAAKISSNSFEMEWPPKSGQKQTFPEIDKAAWLPIQDAAPKLHQGQAIFLDRLATKLNLDLSEPDVPKQQRLL
jgi:predicted NUDIX family NTP pyrophosphohydrolase